jgi:transcriptional regulator with XRE-family HTH domain
MSSATQALVHVLKAELRRAGITYAQLARELGLAESSVKRILAKGDMTLARIDQILGVLRLDFAELARQIAQATPERQQLSEEQERAVVADPKLLLTALSVLSQWTAEQIAATYALSRPQVAACLQSLHRLGVVELRPGARGGPLGYRLKLDKTFRWRPGGPVMRFFREQAMADYFSGDFDQSTELLMLVHGQVSHAAAERFHDRAQRLAQECAQQHAADLSLPAADKRPLTMLVAQRRWMFAGLRRQLRDAHAGKVAAEAQPGR